MNFINKSLSLVVRPAHLIILMLLPLLVQSLIPSTFGSWRETGNGGDSVALDFVRQGNSAIALFDSLPEEIRAKASKSQLLEIAKSARVDSLDRVSLNDPKIGTIEKDAINDSTSNPPRIIVNRTRWAKLDSSERMAIALHEYLGLLGIEINTYAVSSQLKATLDRSNTALPEPEVLFDSGEEASGIELFKARALCHTYEKIFDETYFQIYCEFTSKLSREEYPVDDVYPDYQFLGYRTTESSSYFEGVYRSFRTEEPVIRTVMIPYERIAHFYRTVYRVRVLGVGRLSELPWKTLVNSLSLGTALGKPLPELTYESEEDAWLNCSEVLMARQLDHKLGWKFDRAQCLTFEQKSESGARFYFEIRTQNPFVGI